jgi:serine/threonine-protein kinase
LESAGASRRLVCPACNLRYEKGEFCAKDGTPLIVDPAARAGKPELIGRVLADRYRIQRLIGEGGMGQVFEAQHVNINKRFAIKLLRPEIVSNAEAVARFRQEAWSASSIGHENIIEIDDFATLPDGSVYLAMEFLDGRSLAERMREPEPISVVEGLDIFLQVSAGLGAAHDKGIIHRDMKPENVFIAVKRDRLVAKILDFGIAKVSGTDGGNKMTRTGAIFGTPHYMSPEQALGKPLDHRSDVYSVGVIMYELFTGRVPFEAESFMGILTKHIMAQAVPPRQMAPEREIPYEVESLIMRAMAKEPNDRIQSMHDLGAEIHGLLGVWAPELLQPRISAGMNVARPSGQSAQIGRPPSGQIPLHRTPSGALPLRPPSGQIPLDRTPSGALPLKPPSGQMRPIAPTEIAPSGPHGLVARQPTPMRVPLTPVPPMATPSAPFAPVEIPRKSQLGLWLALGGLIVLGGGAAVFVMMQKPPPPVEAPKPAAAVAAAPVEAPAPVAEVPKPAEPAELEVIVDSVPPGARILKDGAPLAETPEAVKVRAGETLAITLSKKGFLDEPVLVDPSKGRKVLVKLLKASQKGKKGPRPLPHLPVYSMPAEPAHTAPPPPTTAPPQQPPPVVSPAHKKKKDPFERVDDAPKKNPDVLNPY